MTPLVRHATHLLPALLLLASGCLATTGDEGGDDAGYVLPSGDDPADSFATPETFEAGTLTSVRMGGDGGEVHAEDFSSGMFRFHQWGVSPPTDVIRVEIDTSGSFLPVLLVSAPVVEAEEPGRRSNGMNHTWLAPHEVPGRPGVYTADLLVHGLLARRSDVTIMVTSDEAARAEDGRVAASASYTIRLAPFPGWRELAHELECDACGIRHDTEGTEITFSGDQITLDVALEQASFVTRLALGFDEESDARLMGATLVSATGEETAVSTFDLERPWDGSSGLWVGSGVARIRLHIETTDWVRGDFLLTNLSLQGLNPNEAPDSVWNLIHRPAPEQPPEG